MNSIGEQILRVSEFQELKNELDSGRTPIVANGLSAIHKAQVIHGLSAPPLTDGAVIITRDEQTAARLAEEINLFENSVIAYHYPERELALQPMEGISHEYEYMRLNVLTRIAKGEALIVVASVGAALQFTIPKQRLKDSMREVFSGEEISEKDFVRHLLWAGYTRAEQVEGLGQFSTRGGIIDFFSPNYNMPIRIELWGDEIDSISFFSIETQRREEGVKNVEIAPVREIVYDRNELAEILTEKYNSISEKQRELAGETLLQDIDRLKTNRQLNVIDKYILNIYSERTTLLNYIENKLLFIIDGGDVRESARLNRMQNEESIEQLLLQGAITYGVGETSEDYSALMGLCEKKRTVILDSFIKQYPELNVKKYISFNANALSVWSGEINPLIEELKELLKENYSCTILNGTVRGAMSLANDLNNHGIKAEFSSDRGIFRQGMVYVCEGGLSQGYSYPNEKIAVITYGRSAHLSTKKKRRAAKSNTKVIKDIADLEIGDYVVHYNYGIGIFEGIEAREINDIVEDYIKIRYANDNSLLVPVTRLNFVTKYIGGKSDGNVKLSNLNSKEWSKTRQRVKRYVADMAKELIELYSQRMQTKGYAFDEDTEWQRDFEQKFEYEETDDQLRCIEEIKRDMESSSPMDRLLCGDVGFGKTEVALRAAFKCVTSGKQCAVLVPTTILAWQHYQTFLRRMDSFPVTVELLSRFRTPKEQREVIRKLKTGEVDIVIGTHKLLQKDVVFKDLGLCIIDEEQRFGVAHKEKFKQMRTNVDMLTLSATPIPRTLNMAMSGIRDMSVISEAPQDRHPVQSFVLEYNKPLILEAIKREINRGGQVFYLHNRVEDIESKAFELGQELPNVKIGVAHGKMTEGELSKVWKRLIEREIDLLVCTTIIETGVDVPNCNTLIIEDADKMGLSQLYQLRGRVGRSSRRAYAYFTFRKGKQLTDVGEKRLEAIREFTSFGSGFRIAMRDLEIRGAGDILGSQQHGQMESVGYDLYIKLLNDAISEERGEPVKEAIDCSIDLHIDAHIPDGYIKNLNQRIDIYKKIAAISDRDDYEDTLDELIDRFGEPPKSVLGLLDISLIRNTAAGYGISRIVKQGQKIFMFLEEFTLENVMPVMQHSNGKIVINASNNPHLEIQLQRGEKMLEAIEDAFGLMEPKSIDNTKNTKNTKKKD